MRPINLIPPEQRRGLDAPTRTGPLAYVAVGALAAIFAGVLALGITGKQVNDRRSQLAAVQQEKSTAEARVRSLQQFASVRNLAEQRTATVTNLARSRFDWVRVMDELSRVLPGNVWLVNMTATASPSVQVDGGAKVSTRASVTGPALEIVGCATGQDAVAAFVADLKDIDGVTRVGVNSAQRPDRTTGGSPSGGAAGSSDECRTSDAISRFQIVVAFDGVPNPSVPQSAPSAASSATASQPSSGNQSQLVTSP